MTLYKESKYNLILDNLDDNKVIMMNTYTGAVIVQPDDALHMFQNSCVVEEEKVPEDLIKYGFAIRADRNELAEIKLNKRVVGFQDRPEVMHLVIAPTMACNYRCRYCFEAAHTKNATMSDAICRQTVCFIKDQVKRVNPTKGIAVEWFGGEPLLAFDAIRQISEELIAFAEDSDLKYQAEMVTNGLLLTKGIAEELKALKVSSVQITLDGLAKEYAEIKGCREENFDTVISNIKNIEGIVRVLIRINYSNKENAQNLIRYLVKDQHITSRIYIADVRTYQAEGSCMGFTESFEKEKEEIISWAGRFCSNMKPRRPSRRKISCYAATLHSYVIGPTGSVYRCPNLLDKPGMESGDIYSGVHVSSIDLQFIENQLPPKCKECKILPHCMGGCACDRIIYDIEMDCDARIADYIFAAKEAVKDKAKEGKED